MKRFGIAEMLSYIPIAGAGIRQVCRSSTKTRGFVEPVARLACEFSKVVNALLNSRLGTHSAISCRNAWRQSASTVTQYTLRVIGEHVHPDAARWAGRSTCVQTALPGAYETIRHGRDVFIAPHRGNQHSPSLPLISKTWRFCATGAAGSRTATGTAPVAVRGAAGRV